MADEKPGQTIKDTIQDGVKRGARKELKRHKSQNNPNRGLFWGLLLVLLGVMFFTQGRGWLSGVIWWEALLVGLGVVFIIDALFHFMNPSTRHYTVGRLIPGIILFFVGLALLFGFSRWWPLAFVATGVSLFFSSWIVQREIEKRKVTQETLQQSEIKYRHIIDNANSIIMEIDTRGNVTFINKFAQEFFGYKETEILGHNVLGTIVATDPASQGYDKMIEDIVVHPESYLHNEKENILRNGDKVWVVWTYKPILDERNNLKEILCIGINKTEQKKAEDLMAQQLKERTAMEERNRLARDLHDAVSQTLFSTSLIAEVLPRIWERNADEGKKRLEEIRQLTRGALAEMRTLLLELRPVALKDAELNDLIRQLSESINGRARIPVKVDVQGYYALPPDAKTGLYRIAQEALNNIAKHSEATQATVNLDYQPQQVNLTISDNGKGFDMKDVRAQSLGLGIMRERAREINANLSVDSQAGQGTRIMVIWDKGGNPARPSPLL